VRLDYVFVPALQAADHLPLLVDLDAGA